MYEHPDTPDHHHRRRTAPACNEVAAKFWRTVATELDSTCTFERRAVPDQPELPADSWARFGVR